MYQFSDSDSVDSDEGIRYKTESIRNKKPIDKKIETKRKTYSHRIRKRSRSRSRSRIRHDTEKKKSKKRKKDQSPDEKSNRKSSRSKNRSNEKLDDRKNRKERDKSKKDSSNYKREPILQQKLEKSNSDCAVDSEKDPDIERKNEECSSDRSKSTNENDPNLAFGPILPPKVNTSTVTETREETSQNGNTFGPQLPPNLVKKSGEEDNIIGPVLPSHFITVSSLDDDSSVDCDSSAFEDNKESSGLNNVIGPTLPPHLLQKSEEQLTENVGPALPLQLQQRLENDPEASEEQEEDDVYGPVPAGGHYSQAHIELEERALKIKMDQLEPSDSKQPVREEWMLTLPETKAANFGLGPRQFRTKAKPDLSDRSSWTDTPEDKAKKKEGKVEPVVDLKREAELKQIEKRNREQENIAKQHKKEKNSLLDIHRIKLKKEKKNDSGPSERRPFSREIDLQVNRFDEAQKNAVLKKAQLLDTRFSSGESKFL